MFKLIAGKKYVRRNGEVVTILNYLKHIGLLTDGEWVFNAERPDKDGYRIIGSSHPHDIVAPYKAPRKASSPYKKLLTAKEGDIFLLKGEKFKVSEYTYAFLKELQGKVYLTSLERKNNHDYPSAHVRDSKNKALFLREELIDLLRSGEYMIE